jgi:hypothetical protein
MSEHKQNCATRDIQSKKKLLYLVICSPEEIWHLILKTWSDSWSSQVWMDVLNNFSGLVVSY